MDCKDAITFGMGGGAQSQSYSWKEKEEERLSAIQNNIFPIVVQILLEIYV
jgi:hypothetical protein